LKGSED